MADPKIIHLALPKGRMQEGVFDLLHAAGIHVQLPGRLRERNYRPQLSMAGMEAKILKPQNIIEMLHQGSRDIGFAGKDWVFELKADLVELLDTELDPVRMVAAVSQQALLRQPWAKFRQQKKLTVASEYESLTRQWMKRQKIQATFVRSYGATEVFVPEDADVIVDITQSGATLRENQLEIVDELLTSSTRLFAHPQAMADREKRSRIEELVLILRSVLEARKRVMLEVNVSKKNLAGLIQIMPCMREPTISTLHKEAGFAVKAAVPRELLPTLIPEIKKMGGTDIVVTALAQIVG